MCHGQKKNRKKLNATITETIPNPKFQPSIHLETERKWRWTAFGFVVVVAVLFYCPDLIIVRRSMFLYLHHTISPMEACLCVCIHTVRYKHVIKYLHSEHRVFIWFVCLLIKYIYVYNVYKYMRANGWQQCQWNPFITHFPSKCQPIAGYHRLYAERERDGERIFNIRK